MSEQSEHFPSAEAVYASLRIQGRIRDPHFVTEKLGLPPSGTFASGAHGAWHWLMTSRNSVEASCPSCHLDWILDHVEPRMQELGELLAEGIRAQVALFWLADATGEGPLLGSEVMHRLGRLNLSLFIDYHASNGR